MSKPFYLMFFAISFFMMGLLSPTASEAQFHNPYYAGHYYGQQVPGQPSYGQYPIQAPNTNNLRYGNTPGSVYPQIPLGSFQRTEIIVCGANFLPQECRTRTLRAVTNVRILSPLSPYCGYGNFSINSFGNGVVVANGCYAQFLLIGF